MRIMQRDIAAKFSSVTHVKYACLIFGYTVSKESILDLLSVQIICSPAK